MLISSRYREILHGSFSAARDHDPQASLFLCVSTGGDGRGQGRRRGWRAAGGVGEVSASGVERDLMPNRASSKTLWARRGDLSGGCGGMEVDCAGRRNKPT